MGLRVGLAGCRGVSPLVMIIQIIRIHQFKAGEKLNSFTRPFTHTVKGDYFAYDAPRKGIKWVELALSYIYLVSDGAGQLSVTRCQLLQNQLLTFLG